MPEISQSLIKAVALRIDGQTFEAIASEIGVGKSTVHRWSLTPAWERERDRQLALIREKLHPLLIQNAKNAIALQEKLMAAKRDASDRETIEKIDNALFQVYLAGRILEEYEKGTVQ